MLGDDHWTAHPEKGTTPHGTINGTSARDDRRHSVIGLAVRSEPAGSTTNRVHPGRIDRGRRLSHGRDAAQPPRLHGNGRFRGRQKSSRSSPTSSWSCVCLPVCSDWQPCSRTHRPCLISQSTTRGRNHMTCRMIPALASFYQTRSFDKGPIGHDPTHHRGTAFRRSSHRPGTRHVCHQEGRVSAMRGHARHLGARPPRQPRYPGPVPGPRLGALADGYAAP